MLVDSHCHLDFPELSGRITEVLENMAAAGVGLALCPGVTLEGFPAVLELARTHPQIYAAVAVHPDIRDGREADVATLTRWAEDPRVLAVGETGLDYYRIEGDLDWQRERFRVHIAAARTVRKPLIIHTRAAAEDTLAILAEQNAGTIGGVFHCFTESQEVARRVLDLGFYISFSGIVTFKNAQPLREIARWMPLDRLMVETDAPYLAPVPHRGKTNEPAYVRHVAEEIAAQRNISPDALSEASTANFRRLFLAGQLND